MVIADASSLIVYSSDVLTVICNDTDNNSDRVLVSATLADMACEVVLASDSVVISCLVTVRDTTPVGVSNNVVVSAWVTLNCSVALGVSTSVLDSATEPVVPT